MARFFKNRKDSKGQLPGSLIFIGNKKIEKAQITLIDYNKDDLKEVEVNRVEDLNNLEKTATVSWINVYGIHDSEMIGKIGEVFNLPPLLLEDILNTDQRPKFEEEPENLYFILKLIDYRDAEKNLHSDQITLVLGKNYVLTFQEESTRVFEPVRERIRKNQGKIRSSGADYLIYSLIDTIVDDYLLIIGSMGEQIEELGKFILTEPNNTIAHQIYNHKIELNFLRKNVLPINEVILHWLKSDTELVDKKIKSYLRDLADLAHQTVESIEIYSSILTDSLNIYNTNINNRANSIMKVLTLFAALFIPLTFLAGIYGMNFKYMPELSSKYGYPIFWGVTLLIISGLLVFFKRKKWL